MTYVEFFDESAIKNVCTCLTDSPEKVIFIGDNSKKMQRHIKNYQSVFSARGQNIEFTFKTVSKNNLESMISVISAIVEENESCAFDITGGEEIYILALGMVCEKNPDKNIQVHRFNVKNNRIYDCDKDGVTVYKEPLKLSVRENIKIYGGELSRGMGKDNISFSRELTEETLVDLENIWQVCKGNVRLWNVQIGIFSAAEKVGTKSADGLTVTAPISATEAYLKRHKAEFKTIRGIIDALRSKGLLTEFLLDDTTVKLTYKSSAVKRCLTKAGQALEMKIFLTAKSIKNDDGSNLFNDVVNGAVIDWDGTCGDPFETENEIDVLAMHGIVPVFVSCKNGAVTSEELYKLSTVAERFGGKGAKKVLVATALKELGSAGEYLRQRAEDMGIYLIEDVQEMTQRELEKKLANICPVH